MNQPTPSTAGEDASTVNRTHVSGGSVGAIGNHNIVTMPRRTHDWPTVLGSAPPLASAYQQRSSILSEMNGKSALVSQPSGHVLSGTGGAGKTQVAASLFHSSNADLRVWVDGESREAVIVSFAEAAAQLDLADADGDPERLARLFLSYLSATDRTWLVVLDNVTAASNLAGLWPPASGRLIVTTRRRDAAFSSAGRAIVDVDVFTEEEARDYLLQRISSLLDKLPENTLTERDELAEDLGRLPLALAQAAAVIIDEGVTCGRYRTWFADRTLALDELFPTDADADGYAKTVATTWDLAVTAADRLAPIGLARPIASLAAMLDPSGAPENVLTSQAARTYLSETAGTQVTEGTARKAVRALHRLSLIDHDPDDGNARAIRMHNLTGRAIRQTLVPEIAAAICRCVADGLLEVWPPTENKPLLAESLRGNTAALVDSAAAELWASGEVHPVLFRSGHSLNEAGLIGPSIQYHKQLQDTASQRLGTDHPDALALQNSVAYAYMLAGNLDQSIPLYEQNLKKCTQILGSDHSATLLAQNNLAYAYQQAGKLQESIALHKQTLQSFRKIRGRNHPDTLASKTNLALAYQAAGELHRAIRLHERNLADYEETLGRNNPATLRARNNLAGVYQVVGRFDQAIPLHEQNYMDYQEILGTSHPSTLNSRNNLAGAYQEQGDLDRAIPLHEQNLVDHEELLGPEHPATLNSRNNLAGAYQAKGNFERATALYEQNLAQYLDICGPNHPDTLRSRGNLAGAYQEQGKLDQAISLFKLNLNESQRVLGREHPSTLNTRNHLAIAYQEQGRLDQAIPHFELNLAESQRIFGSDHPFTLQLRENLVCALEQS